MTKTTETMPDASAIRFLEAEHDGTYTDYKFVENGIAWQLTHDLTDNTWSGLVGDDEATPEQVTALYGCMTDEQRADAEQEFKDQAKTSDDHDDEPSQPTMRR